MKCCNYRVVWEMDISASSPEEAARKAREYQAAPDSSAVTFDVFNEDGEVSRINLLALDSDKLVDTADGRNIFAEAALSVTFTINDPDAEGPLVSKRSDLLAAIAVSNIRSQKYVDAYENAGDMQKRVLNMLTSNNQLIADIMKVNGLLVEDLVGSGLRFLDKLDPKKVNLLQYQTRSFQNKSGLHAKMVTLEDFRHAAPSGHLSWMLPNGLQLTFLH